MIFSQNDASSLPISSQPARTLPARRASRLRLSWFVLGTLFGILVGYCLFCAFHSKEEQQLSKNIKASAVYALSLLQSSLATTHIVSNAAASLPSPAQAPAAAPVTAAKANTPAFPASRNLSVQPGDTLMSMLIDNGIDEDEAYQIVDSMKKIYNPKRLGVGQSLELHLDKSKEDETKPTVAGLSIAVSPLKTVSLSREADDSFTAREIKAEVYKDVVRGGGTINSSLYQTGIDSGVPPQLLGEVINALAYDVDFQRDIKEGDRLDVVYERMHTDKNVTAGYGSVLYASLTLGDRRIDLYRHTSSDGFSGYYNAKGESVKKALLKTPINGAHITSSFGMRMHPLLGYSRMHKGIDFGAATGTPIYAAGDGVIAEADHKAGYGNYVRVKHNATYDTAYAHASRFARGIHPGVHVKQGQVIAYVGATGMATGPHLHYEILVNGQQVNPSGVKFRTGQTLAGRELVQFKHEMSKVQTALATLPQKTEVADLNR